jgi:hypothetical protein
MTVKNDEERNKEWLVKEPSSSAFCWNYAMNRALLLV